MSNIIDSYILILSILKENEYCTISELYDLKRKIESQHPEIFIDVSKDSVLYSLSLFPKLLKLDGDKITKTRTQEDSLPKPDVIFNKFYNKLPNTIKLYFQDSKTDSLQLI